jgi:glycosyltransferase involved in cell wall biosynthesis
VSPLRVLITIRSLELLGGAEVYVRDLARGLIRRGHQAVVYSTRLGDAAKALRSATIPVIDDLGQMGAEPMVIHGNSSMETMAALLRFSGVCHGWYSWATAPPRFPRIRRYVAVDDTCRDRLLLEEKIPPSRMSVLLNAVDLERFPRRAPLPPTPSRALVFSNYANEMTHLDIVRRACTKAGMSLDVMGWSSGTASASPESTLGGYDVVFAKGKSAIEALAVGSAVILCDATGMGSLVTSDAVASLRRLNFGARALDRPVDEASLLKEIRRYDAADAARVSDAMRAEASGETLIEALISLYEDVIAEQTTDAPSAAEEALATSEYLQGLASALGRPLDSEQLFPVLGLANRMLRVPVVGSSIRWVARKVAGSPKLGKGR